MTYSQINKPKKNVPQRSCTVCRVKFDKGKLLRVVKHPEGGAVIDTAGKLPGRGAYICPDEQCISRAKKSGVLAHVLGTVIQESFWNELEDYAKNHDVDSAMKIKSVLGLSRKAGILLIGTDKISEYKHKLLVMTAKDSSDSVKEFAGRYEHVNLDMSIQELSETIGSRGGVQIIALPRSNGFAKKIESMNERRTAVE